MGSMDCAATKTPGREPKASRRRELRWWVRGGMLLLLVSACLFAVTAWTLASARAYATAPVCPTGTRLDTCTTTARATVEGTDSEVWGKGKRYYVRLTEQGSPEEQHVLMAGSGPVVGMVSPGDTVTLTYWQGEIARLRSGSLVQETKASPADDWRLPTVFALFALPPGLGLLLAWRLELRRPRSMVPGLSMVVLVTACFVAGVAPLGAMGGESASTALLVTAAAVPPSVIGAALVVWWVRRRMRRAQDTGDIVPVLPTHRQTLGAVVHGDVPYSVDGFGLLVVGDGRPAATPDPTGRFARRVLPESLVVERCRALRSDDPPEWFSAYDVDGVVVECRDGEQPVLVVTRRRDAPLVLGALGGAPTAN